MIDESTQEPIQGVAMRVSNQSQPKFHSWSSWIGCLGLFFILTASKCENETRFIAAKQEICADGIDNDDDGKTDCADSYCEATCALELTVNPTFTTAADSQTVSGRQKYASKIVVEILPNSESNGAATITAGEWAFLARKLVTGINTLTITATDSAGKTKQVTTTIKVSTSNL
jgi:hypothetical protein